MLAQFAQISDCHIGVKENNQNLAKVIAKINNMQINTIVFSGDITEDGTLSQYLQFQAICQDFVGNIFVLAGNHDNITNMAKVFSPSQLNDFQLGKYNILLIPSKIDNQVFGNINIQAINDTKKNTILITHHPVLNMQSEWNDDLSINNKKQFLQFLQKSQNIKMVSFGHSHEAKDFVVAGNKNQIKIYSCPSSAYQFNAIDNFGFNLYQLDDCINKNTIWLSDLNASI